MNILMLSSTFPYPPTRGGTQVRTFYLLRHLSQRHSITLATLRSPEVTESDIEELRSWVSQLVVFPRLAVVSRGFGGKVQRFAQFLWQGTPANVWSSHSPALQQWVDNFVATGQCDVITCEHSVNEIYVRPEWRNQVRTVVNIHSSIYGTCRQMLEAGIAEKPWRDRLYLPLLKRYERRYCSKFSHLVVTTEEDRQHLPLSIASQGQTVDPLKNPFQRSNASIAVIPNGVDLAKFPVRSTDPGGHRLIFVGVLDNWWNIDAVKFLSLEILPALQQRYPDTQVTLVGANPVPEVLSLQSQPGVEVAGRVPKVADYLHRSTVAVIPMRMGFGIKNKTLEAMAAGTPVVASDRGLEGLPVDGNFSLKALRANRLEEYVEAIGRLFEDESLRRDLSQRGRSLIESDYTWDTIAQRYEAVLCQGEG